MKRIASLYVAWLVATAMLVLAVTGRYPYGFYMLLRWICCAVFAYSAFATHEENRVPWVWVFGLLAVLFNPIVPFRLQRDTWQIVDWCAIGVIVVAAIVFWGDKGAFSEAIHRGKKETIVVWIALLLLIASWLYPPWVRAPHSFTSYHSDGFYFLFDPWNTGMRIDWTRLLDLIVVAIAAGVEHLSS